MSLQEVNTVEEMKYLAKALDRYLAPLPSPTRYAGCVLSTYPVLETRLFNDSGPGALRGSSVGSVERLCSTWVSSACGS